MSVYDNEMSVAQTDASRQEMYRRLGQMFGEAGDAEGVAMVDRLVELEVAMIKARRPEDWESDTDPRWEAWADEALPLIKAALERLSARGE